MPDMANREIPSRDSRMVSPVLPAGDVVDKLLARYVDWREDASAVADAYRGWCEAPAGEKTWRFSAYMAALDDEESSAKTYAVEVAEVERSLA
jgi:hypothetical protein